MRSSPFILLDPGTSVHAPVFVGHDYELLEIAPWTITAGIGNEFPGPLTRHRPFAWNVPIRRPIDGGRWEARVRLTTERDAIAGGFPTGDNALSSGLAMGDSSRWSSASTSFMWVTTKGIPLQVDYLGGGFDVAFYPGRVPRLKLRGGSRAIWWSLPSVLPELAQGPGQYEVCLAADFDAKKAWFGINGIYAGDPIAGTDFAVDNIPDQQSNSPTRYTLACDLRYPGDIIKLLPPSEWSTPGLPGYTSWVQWPTLSGRAHYASGQPPEEIRILDENGFRDVGNPVIAPDGSWSQQVPPGQYWVQYLSDGCAPELHGPYTASLP